MSKIINELQRATRLPANSWSHLRIRVESFLSRHHHHVARKRKPTATFKILNDYLTLVDIEILQTKIHRLRFKPGTQRMFGTSAFHFEFIALSLCED